MKRFNFLFALVAVAAMTSCSKDESENVVVAQKGKALEFRVLTDKTPTRSAIITLGALQGFNVYSSLDGVTANDVFNDLTGVSLYKAGGSYLSSSPINWPNAAGTGTVNYYAFAYDGIASNASIATTNNINVADDVIKVAVDLSTKDKGDYLVAATKQVGYASSIPLVFKHIAAGVRFEVKNASLSDKATVLVHELSINNIIVSDEFHIDGSQVAAGGALDLTEAAWDYTTGGWAAATKDSLQLLSATNDIGASVPQSKTVYFPSETGAAYVIPQTAPYSSAADFALDASGKDAATVAIKIIYSVIDQNGVVQENKVTKRFWLTQKLSTAFSFQAVNFYTFQIEFAANNVVNFNPSVDTYTNQVVYSGDPLGL